MEHQIGGLRGNSFGIARSSGEFEAHLERLLHHLALDALGIGQELGRVRPRRRGVTALAKEFLELTENVLHPVIVVDGRPG